MIDVTFAVIENDEERRELEDFYSENKSRLYRIALSKLHNASDAEDAVQEVFARIADKPERFFDIPPGERIAYTDVIVRNIAVDMFNRRALIPVDPLEEGIGDSDIPLDDGMLGRCSRDEIVEFIERLPELQRNVLSLHCLFDLTIDETAQRLGISLAAAKKRLMLARKAIRAFIEERGEDHE